MSFIGKNYLHKSSLFRFDPSVSVLFLVYFYCVFDIRWWPEVIQGVLFHLTFSGLSTSPLCVLPTENGKNVIGKIRICWQDILYNALEKIRLLVSVVFFAKL
jgi:hypothetical protein